MRQNTQASLSGSTDIFVKYAAAKRPCFQGATLSTAPPEPKQDVHLPLALDEGHGVQEGLFVEGALAGAHGRLSFW